MSVLKLFDEGYDLVVLRAMIDAGSITLEKTPNLGMDALGGKRSKFFSVIARNTRAIVEAHETIKSELALIEAEARMKNHHETEIEKMVSQKTSDEDIPF